MMTTMLQLLKTYIQYQYYFFVENNRIRAAAGIALMAIIQQWLLMASA
jgi:hypothetical protein